MESTQSNNDTKSLMRCCVCDSSEWESVDQYRVLEKHKDKPVGMSICTKCGFVSYPEKYKTEDEIKAYYKNEYRGGPPTMGNLYTGARKLHYHNVFLQEVFAKWESTGCKPVIGEVGSAIGMVLNWFRKVVPGCEVHGVELTSTFKNVAYQEYGIKLEDDLDLSRKYDLIVSYKVAEHQLDIDKRIREYALALTDGGYLYISVPTWFNALQNSGIGGFDLEYYYHPDHINVWTRLLFEEILRKSGLAIIKTDRLIYGDTYLCKRNDDLMSLAPQYEDPEQIKASMARIKEAHDFMEKRDPVKALERWGNFPVAWAFLYESKRKEIHEKHKGNGLEIANVFCGEMEKACGQTLDVLIMKADIYSRYGHQVEAIETLEQILELKPNDFRALLNMSHCFRAIAKSEKDRIKRSRLLMTSRDICRKIIQIDEQARPEAYNWALKDESELLPEDIELILKEDNDKQNKEA